MLTLPSGCWSPSGSTGTPLSSIIRDGSQEERDRAGLLLIRFLYSCPGPGRPAARRPAPGNFRLLPDGRLGVIDYGAVNRLPDGLPEPIGRLARLAIEGKADAVLAGLRAEGFVLPAVQVDAQGLLDYVRPLLEPVATPTAASRGAWLRQEAARLGDPRSPAAQLGRQLNLPAVVPADPPGDARCRRRAVPARQLSGAFAS